MAFRFWMLTKLRVLNFLPKNKSIHQNYTEIIYIGERWSGDHLITQTFKKAMAIIVAERCPWV